MAALLLEMMLSWDWKFKKKKFRNCMDLCASLRKVRPSPRASKFTTEGHDQKVKTPANHNQQGIFVSYQNNASRDLISLSQLFDKSKMTKFSKPFYAGSCDLLQLRLKFGWTGFNEPRLLQAWINLIQLWTLFISFILCSHVTRRLPCRVRSRQHRFNNASLKATKSLVSIAPQNP